MESYTSLLRRVVALEKILREVVGEDPVTVVSKGDTFQIKSPSVGCLSDKFGIEGCFFCEADWDETRALKRQEPRPKMLKHAKSCPIIRGFRVLST